METGVLIVTRTRQASDLRVGAAKIEGCIKAELFQVRVRAW